MEKKEKTFFKGDFGYSKEGLWFENIFFFPMLAFYSAWEKFKNGCIQVFLT